MDGFAVDYLYGGTMFHMVAAGIAWLDSVLWDSQTGRPDIDTSAAALVWFHPLQIRIAVVHAEVRGHRSDWSGDKALGLDVGSDEVPVPINS